MNEKGISLSVLIITIVVLGLITSITMYTGMETIGNTRMKKLDTELKIIQVRCNELLSAGWTQEDFLSIGQKVSEIESSKTRRTITEAVLAVTETTNTENYIYYDKTGLEKLGVIGIDREIAINLSEKIILDINGVKDNNGDMIYTIEWVGYSTNRNNTENIKINFGSTTRYGLVENNEIVDEENENNTTDTTTLKSFEYTNDEMRLNFTLVASTYEKINIPIINLEVGKNYKLYFSQSNDCTVNTTNNYGCTILDTETTETTSKISSLLWSQTTEAAIKKSINQAITFEATTNTMYWTWDFSRLKDTTEASFRIYDIHIVEVD